MRRGPDFGTLGNYETSADADQRRRHDRRGRAGIRRPPVRSGRRLPFPTQQAGLTYQDPAAAIAVAKAVCALVDKGTPDSEIVKNLQLRNPGFTGDGAARFTTLAAGEYCPKYLTGEGPRNRKMLKATRASG